MTFLTMLIVVLVYSHWLGDHPLRRILPFSEYQQWFVGRQLGTGVRFTLCLLLPVVVVGLLLILIAQLPAGLGAVGWLLLSLLVLCYCIDSINLRHRVERHLQWLKGLGNDEDVGDVRARQHSFMMTTGYRTFQSIHPVLFWFLLLGPIGALIYGLSRRYQQGLEAEDPEAHILEQFVYLLEWLPVRVSGLIFGLLGNFDACTKVWLENLFSLVTSSESLLRRLIHSAISEVDYSAVTEMSRFKDLARQDVCACQSLLGRALYGWLGVAALLTIIGW